MWVAVGRRIYRRHWIWVAELTLMLWVRRVSIEVVDWQARPCKMRRPICYWKLIGENYCPKYRRLLFCPTNVLQWWYSEMTLLPRVPILPISGGHLCSYLSAGWRLPGKRAANLAHRTQRCHINSAQSQLLLTVDILRNVSHGVTASYTRIIRCSISLKN